VLKPYIAEADAIASAHSDSHASGTEKSANTQILCVDASADLLVYLRGLLKEAGHRVVTAENLHDGLILLKTVQPRVVVMGSALHALRGTSSAEEFHRRLSPNGLVVLPSGFSSQDAGEAAATLMREVRDRLG
jgi:DNA-binding NtrC family response regulator